MSSPDVIVVGDINVDILAPVDHYPLPGGHALAEELRVEGGGSAANTAVLLGLLGLEVTMLGRVGDDPLADWVLTGMEAAGVDVSTVRRDAGATTGLFCVAVTPDGERTMFGGRGANGRLSPDDIDAAVIETGRWLHLSGYQLLSESGRAALQKAADVARRAAISISLDVGIGPATGEWRAAVIEVAAGVDVLLPNQVEAELLTGETHPPDTVRRLKASGARTVVVKLGARGCYAAAGSEEWALPGFDVDVVDSTGAGDAFNAGFIAGQLVGFDLRASALLANALGGLATTAMGAGNAVLGPASVLPFLEERRHDQQWAGWAGEFDVVCAWLRQCLSG